MKRPNPGLVVALSLWLALAEAQTPSPTQRLTPNFRDAQISDLAEMVGRATGITFIPDSRVRATVNMINPQPVTPQQFYQQFLSILSVNGFAGLVLFGLRTALRAARTAAVIFSMSVKLGSQRSATGSMS